MTPVSRLIKPGMPLSSTVAASPLSAPSSEDAVASSEGSTSEHFLQKDLQTENTITTIGPKENDVPSLNKFSQALLPCVLSQFTAIALRESIKFFSPFLVTLSQSSSSLARCSFSFGSCSRAPSTSIRTIFRAFGISSSSSGYIICLRSLDAFSTACIGMFASRVFEDGSTRSSLNVLPLSSGVVLRGHDYRG
jgi:hypothetical protein